MGRHELIGVERSDLGGALVAGASNPRGVLPGEVQSKLRPNGVDGAVVIRRAIQLSRIRRRPSNPDSKRANEASYAERKARHTCG